MSLTQDYTTVPGQLYACISIVGPTSPQKTDQHGVKIRGAFATRDEASNHAKRLQKEDPVFDIYVVEMGKWLLIPPDPSMIDDAHYTNAKLEELMTGYRENQAMAAQMFNERKTDMMGVKNADGTENFHKPGDVNSQYYNKGDEKPLSHPGEVIERLKREKPDAPMEELVKEADTIVAAEVEERRKARELAMKSMSPSAITEEEEVETEVEDEEVAKEEVETKNV